MSDTEQKTNPVWQSNKVNIISTLNTLALFLCAICLALIAFRLGPVSKWANYQDICVEEISKTYPIEYSVRKCNGRSKIYMPKTA